MEPPVAFRVRDHERPALEVRRPTLEDVYLALVEEDE